MIIYDGIRKLANDGLGSRGFWGLCPLWHFVLDPSPGDFGAFGGLSLEVD